MNAQEIHIGKHHWYIRTYGSGDRLLIALHGFGEDGSVFGAWEKTLGKDFTLLAVDLPHHGHSAGWAIGSFTPDAVTQMIDGLVSQHDVSEYSLAGHSFGARILIRCMDDLELRPKNIWLLAPDGLATRRMGLPDLIPLPLRHGIARRMDHRYRFWLKLAEHLWELGLIDIFSIRYLRYHLSDQQRRERLMGTWCALPCFSVNKRELLALAQSDEPKLHLVIGERDPLIDWGRLAAWLAQWPAGRLYRLATGHQLVNEQTGFLIQQEN